MAAGSAGAETARSGLLDSRMRQGELLVCRVSSIRLMRAVGAPQTPFHAACHASLVFHVDRRCFALAFAGRRLQACGLPCGHTRLLNRM